MVAKVCSWCGSRLGASAAMAASRTPPRRGVSAAWTAAGTARTREPIRTASARTVTSVRWRRMSILREPDVLELLIGEVTRRSYPVLHFGPVHDVARPPEARHVVGVLQHDLLDLDADLAPFLNHVHGEVLVGELDVAVFQHHLEPVRVARVGQEPPGLGPVLLGVPAEARKLFELGLRHRPLGSRTGQRPDVPETR